MNTPISQARIHGLDLLRELDASDDLDLRALYVRRARRLLAHALPTPWGLCFVIGSAWVMFPERPPTPSWRPTLCLAALAALSVVALRGHAWTYVVAGPAAALLTAARVRSWRGWRAVTARWLAPVVGLGTVSYGVYLWDHPLTVWLRPSLGDHSAYAGLLAALLAVPIALLGWTSVERRWTRRPARIQVGGTAR